MKTHVDVCIEKFPKETYDYFTEPMTMLHNVTGT